MRTWWRWIYGCVTRLWRSVWQWWAGTGRRRPRPYLVDRAARPRHPIHPKPKWVKQEVIRLKALCPQAGCRTIAHCFNRRWGRARSMTVGKTYVANICRRHQYLIHEARRGLKHRVPRPIPRNRIWGCDLLTKTDQRGEPHLALALVDHASRACLRLQQLPDKSSLRLLRELIEAVKQYGLPQFLRTDNEAVFVSRLFRLGLWVLGIRHQRTEPGCPWQNGRVERFIGTVKRELATEPIRDCGHFKKTLGKIRIWYNHNRPHDHLHGRTPAEVWARIDVFAPRSRTGRGPQTSAVTQDSG